MVNEEFVYFPSTEFDIKNIKEMKEGSDNFRESAIIDIIEVLSKSGPK